MGARVLFPRAPFFALGRSALKSFVLVDGVGQVPSKARENLLVVTQSNWQEMAHFLEGKTGDFYLFLHQTCPSERLLKAVEDYRGNLAVYATDWVSPVFLSRFTRVVSRKSHPRHPVEGYPPVSRAEERLEALFRAIG